MYRQGDVLLIPVDSKPTGCKPVARENGRVILAHGEVTGHAHAIDDKVAQLFERSGVEDRVLVLDGAAALTHEEHGTIELPAGTYTVRRQREFDDMDEVRRVAD